MERKIQNQITKLIFGSFSETWNTILQRSDSFYMPETLQLYLSLPIPFTLSMKIPTYTTYYHSDVNRRLITASTKQNNVTRLASGSYRMRRNLITLVHDQFDISNQFGTDKYIYTRIQDICTSNSGVDFFLFLFFQSFVRIVIRTVPYVMFTRGIMLVLCALPTLV